MKVNDLGSPIPSKKEQITDPTVGRLVAYRRLLMRLVDEGVPVVSSKEMGEMLRIKSSQVRKDLSYLGEFGKRGVGYDVSRLLEDLAGILAPFEMWHIGWSGRCAPQWRPPRRSPFKSPFLSQRKL